MMRYLIPVIAIALLAAAWLNNMEALPESPQAPPVSTESTAAVLLPKSEIYHVQADAEKAEIAVKETPRQNVVRVRELSSFVLLNSSQRKELDEILSQQELQDHVKITLSNPRVLTTEQLSVRTAVLDVLYEGLKSKDANVSTTYYDLAERILTADLPTQIAEDSRAAQEFIGDRVELAMVASQASPELFSQLKQRSLARRPETQIIFNKAEKLKTVYKVSL